MKRKSLETMLYSAVGVAAMAVILVALNLVGGSVKERIDLTKEKAYTLSAGTRAILGKLASPVTIRFYCSQGETPTPETVYLKNYARRVDDLLEEYRQAAHGKIILQRLDPEPDSDAEDSARLDGVEGQMLDTGDKFYLGIAVSRLDNKQAVTLDPSRERLLEYDLSRAISRVVTPTKPVIGIMSALPLSGSQSNPMMMQMGQQGTPPWAIFSELKGDFDVREVPLAAETIDPDIKVLLVVHPAGISEGAQYAIDQFVLRGGKLIAFVDPQCLADTSRQNPMMGGMSSSASSLPKLFAAWGLQFSESQVVADRNFKMELNRGDGTTQEAPAFLSVTPEGINTNDITTSELDNLWLPFVGAFTGKPAAGLTETVLLHSTKDSELTDATMAKFSGESILTDFKPSGVEYALAVKLTGKFKTAFPDGQPKAEGADGTNAAPAAPELKESAQTNVVVLVGDADLLYDNFALRRIQSPFGNMAMAMNANLNFAQNVVEQLAGDDNLITVRSRAVLNRPFTRVKEMEAAAQAKFDSKIKDLQQSQADTEQRLRELQQNKSTDERYILSPEQRTEIEKLRKQEVEVARQLKQVQKDLRREVVAMQNRIEWLNIAAMPVVVTLFGVLLAWRQRKRTSAK
ncbi:MAG TPA: Gldg family protein [Dongiaceae bacterium]|nr:Gldg family protein [Dongiaceae bacterium]